MANASLIDMGDGTIQDTSTNLLWLKDWSLSGTGNWLQQTDWASRDFASSTGWRMPTRAEYSGIYSPMISTTPPWTNVPAAGAGYWTSDRSERVSVTCPGPLIPVVGCTAEGAFAVGIGYGVPTLPEVARPLSEALYAQKVRSYVAPGPAPVPVPATLGLVLLGLLAATTAKSKRPGRGYSLAMRLIASITGASRTGPVSS